MQRKEVEGRTMTVQVEETMQETGDDRHHKGGRISFSVASLLADTRPSRTPPAESTPNPHQNSSDEEYDSNQEDSIVDVEDLDSSKEGEERSGEEEAKNNGLHQHHHQQQQQQQGPIRPTPFSALAAAVYQAAHPNWTHQGLVPAFGGPGPMFQGPAHFGVPSMTTGRICGVGTE